MEKQNKIQTLVFTGSKIERACTKAIIYLSGCAIFSIGATFFILSHLGTDPLDVLSVGVRNTFGLLIGTTQSLFAVMCLVIWSALHILL
jgi:uncharacterized membrane protein YczE